MPSSLSAVIKRIDSLHNDDNRRLIDAFVDFMKHAEHFLDFHPPIITARQIELHNEILRIAAERDDISIQMQKSMPEIEVDDLKSKTKKNE